MKIILNLLVLIFFISCSNDDESLISDETAIKPNILFVVAGQSNAVGIGKEENSVFLELPCFEYNSNSNTYTSPKDTMCYSQEALNDIGEVVANFIVQNKVLNQ